MSAGKYDFCRLGITGNYVDHEERADKAEAELKELKVNLIDWSSSSLCIDDQIAIETLIEEQGS